MSTDGTAGAIKSFGAAPRRSSATERTAVIVAACGLAAAIFALGFAVSDPGEAVAVLYTLPIPLVAVELGAADGIIAAAVAVALLGIWTTVDDVDLNTLGFLTRSTGFFLLGALLGYFSTKLRTAYETVHRREEQLLAILDNTTAVISLKDSEGRFTLVNRKFEDLLDLTQDEVRGRTVHDLFPRYMADAIHANDRRVMKECCALEFEETAPQEGGAHTYLSVKFPLLDDDGKPYGVCSISTDITARKQAEQQLKDSKDRVREILDTAQEAFVAMDDNGNVTAWNRAAEQTFGWPSEKAIGKPMADLIVPPRYGEAHRRGLDKFLKTGKGPILNKRIELMAMNRDGREFPVEMTVSPARIRGGFTFNAFMHDISDRKQVEREAVKLSTVTAAGNGGEPS